MPTNTPLSHLFPFFHSCFFCHYHLAFSYLLHSIVVSSTPFSHIIHLLHPPFFHLLTLLFTSNDFDYFVLSIFSLLFLIRALYFISPSTITHSFAYVSSCTLGIFKSSFSDQPHTPKASDLINWCLTVYCLC